jgi:hypothetical protein
MRTTERVVNQPLGIHETQLGLGSVSQMNAPVAMEL